MCRGRDWRGGGGILGSISSAFLKLSKTFLECYY